MHYKIEPGKVKFFLENPKKDAPSGVNFTRTESKLTDANLQRICSTLVLQLKGLKPATQRTQLGIFLKPLLAFFSHSGSSFPITSNGWQLFLLNFFRFFLTSSESSTATGTGRISSWVTVVTGIFRYWQKEEIVPFDITIPSIRLKNVKSDAIDQKLLGKPAKTLTRIRSSQKTLASTTFSESDADYLKNIEKDCRERIGIIKTTCLAHWDGLVSDSKMGKSFAESAGSIDDVINSGRYSEKIRGGSLTPLASPNHPDGHIWALAVARSMLLKGDNQNCVSVQSLKESEFFPITVFAPKYYGILKAHSAMPAEAFIQLSLYGQFSRFLGNLSPMDAAAAICLLTIEHPNFNSESLQHAKIMNSRGKSYLLITDNDESSIFSVDKPRAGKRKIAALTPTSEKLIKEILALTALAREVLKKSGDKAWRYLFLGYGKGGRLVALSPKIRYLTDEGRGNSLLQLYPVLSDYGLIGGTFDYRRIRTTMGVLKWFETGSVREMSYCLGNSNRVVLEHYIPPSLLHAWNTRIIRRLQNTLIILAAHDEHYLLEVSDFSKLSDLHSFVEQLLLEYPASSSPLADQVQARLGKLGQQPVATEHEIGDAILNIRLSPAALSYLYAYGEFASNTLSSEQLRQTDFETKLSPSHFADLARMIRHACENGGIAPELRELLDLSALKNIHEKAIALLPNLREKFSKFYIVKN